MTSYAEENLKKISKLIEENPDSVLNFNDKKNYVKSIVKQQQEKLTVMRAINKQIKQLVNKPDSTRQIKQLKNDFSSLFKEYEQNNNLAEKVLIEITLSYQIEKDIEKKYLIKETENMLSKLEIDK